MKKLTSKQIRNLINLIVNSNNEKKEKYNKLYCALLQRAKELKRIRAKERIKKYQSTFENNYYLN